MIVAAGKFKSHCLRYIDEINETHEELIITKRGIPTAKLVPVSQKPAELFGMMKGTAEITGDIISPVAEAWDAAHE
ncbi:MAG: hypothetical protein A2268_10935 [Candidatus Raymondbacteria bacterium RifOxyA12_full_50_37]|uniref:Antitoxin n=1 Tax=Candidatus Raymondbacteria bacterium RIFOXYD12_FULL_49_13 TaxID=1817890 RepID=A0A1F7F2A3_UNCRA|nr:MAG: hypothetical protein A2268_10935 [Candidatus Raymondbacteria bacterium RifOxyA12_full_50_37]OGJ85526.1 MAG: hypothetical protein A2248_12720 [Candidatus Raymondbacteria bacterium RIFOXYA2_FULL_49_16]OGJ95029.1 MAG: hypothetical protein A2453_07420 [Candidatus Raymondbacteria bacterium RIFOXYC2_FULL_50_21]OGK00693.1 MAG: hypothetical protein A2519_20065 [Candidatus Raymondbacteria bacterium RIFOXYD12_FULL_49_13]OGK02666.1 MAG: hypothetical protein A2350_07115 [Candidatus Raymondbacteria 